MHVFTLHFSFVLVLLFLLNRFPRLIRFLCVIYLVADKFGESASASSEEYTRRRYALGVAEGASDLPPGQPFPLECNASFLNAGVCFL